MTSGLSDFHTVDLVAENISVDLCWRPGTFWKTAEHFWTHGGRYLGLWRPSLGAGRKMACTARSCVQLCCEDSLRRPPRSRSLMPCTRPCRSDMSLSDGYSCTLKQNRELSQEMNKRKRLESLGEALGAKKKDGTMSPWLVWNRSSNVDQKKVNIQKTKKDKPNHWDPVVILQLRTAKSKENWGKRSENQRTFVGTSKKTLKDCRLVKTTEDSLLQALVLRPSAGLHGRSWWKSWHCSQLRPLVLWLHMQWPWTWEQNTTNLGLTDS